MALSGSFAKHMSPEFRDVVGTTFKRWDASYSRFLKVISTNRQYEKFFGATTIPKAVAKPEGQPISFYDPLEGNSLTVTPSSYAIGVQISREAWDDDLYKSKSALRRSAKALASSFAELVETDAADIFNSGFTSYGTVDGASALFSTSHPRLDGGTAQANRPAADAALSLSALRAGVLQFEKWYDDRGNRIRSRPSILLTHPDKRFKGIELLQTPGKPGGMDNDVNASRGIVQHLTWPYLTSTTAWYLLAPEHYLYFVWRTRPMMDAYDDRNTKVAKFTIWGRFGKAAVHWNGTYGTTGV